MSEEIYYVVSYDGKMMAMIEIKEPENFNYDNFMRQMTEDGYKVQCITKEQKDILMPKDLSLN
jgi:hypothetical protein